MPLPPDAIPLPLETPGGLPPDAIPLPAVQSTPGTPSRGWMTEALPIGGAILGGLAGAASPIPGGAAIGTGLGAGIGEEAAQLSEMARGMRTTPSVGKILRTTGEQAAMEAVGGPILRGIGRAVKTGATKLYETLLPRSMYEARWVQAYRAGSPLWQRVTAAFTGQPAGPRTVAQTVTEQGLMGGETGLGVQARRATQSLWGDVLQPALRSNPTRIHLPDFFDSIEAAIKRDTPELARQGDLVEALDSLRESYKGMSDISLEQLQNLKRGWAEFVPEKAYRGKSIAGAFNQVKDEAADLARQAIYDALGPTKRQAYLDYGNLLSVIEHGQKAMTGGRLRGGFGGFWTAIKDMALTPVATVGGQVVYRTGQGLELIGKPGARVVRDILAGAPEVGEEIPSPEPVSTPAARFTPTPTPTAPGSAGTPVIQP